MIRVIVADANIQTLLALTTMLRELPDLCLVGEADSADKLLEVAETNRADVIIVDRKLSGSSTSTLLARLHSLEPRPFVIVMGYQVSHSRWALSAGADAFVSKDDDAQWLVESIYSYRGQQ